jgi:DNA-directed RNA polymerase subunit E'/Rpb7
MFTIKTYRIFVGEIVDGMVREISANGLSMNIDEFKQLCELISDVAYLHHALKELEANESPVNWELLRKRVREVANTKYEDYSAYCEIVYAVRKTLIQLTKTKPEEHKS